MCRLFVKRSIFFNLVGTSFLFYPVRHWQVARFLFTGNTLDLRTSILLVFKSQIKSNLNEALPIL